MNITNIKELVEKSKNKDNQAFGELFDFYYPKILSYALRSTTNLDHAKDITSNTFIKTLTGLKNFKWKDNASFNGWIYKIASNEINQFFRKQRKYKSVITINDNKFDLSDNDESSKKIKTIIENDEYLKILNDTLKNLNPIHQNIIRLRYVEDLSYEEISKAIGKNESTIRVYCLRAKEKLKNIIEKNNKEFLEK
ncbi:MAG: RNA polymerase sigma factor [Candidatus Paceibacterota bacterium]|jgi:RNA polymerase sigma-70 factor (ECF subfamily)|nr:RNA polymerase sigma factor [bacterium]